MDPASLENLVDIVEPPPVSWWPPALGWYVIGIALGLVLLWTAWSLLRRHRANRYRRVALLDWQRLHELAQEPSGRAAALEMLPELVKRVALVAYPRAEIASLSGEPWFKLLRQTGPSAGLSTELAESVCQLGLPTTGCTEIQ